MQRRRFTPSPALAVALIALFVALGGTSYAAITALPANSVGTKQLKNGAVTAAKISPAPLRAVKVGAPGAPPYLGDWKAASSGDESVSFYKDPWGIVHLEGAAASISPTTGWIFTLPAGYRPAGNLYFVTYGSDSRGTASVEVTTAGQVVEFAQPQDYVGLSNITFRARR